MVVEGVVLDIAGRIPGRVGDELIALDGGLGLELLHQCAEEILGWRGDQVEGVVV